jgi:hypothetical protein
MNKKKKDAASAPSVAFTGDLGVPEYQNAGGRFVKTRIPYGSQFNRAVDKFSGQEYYIPRYQNAGGDFLSQDQMQRLRRIAANNPQRAQRVAARMTSRLR